MLGGMGIQGMNVIPLQRFMQAQRRPPQKRKDEDDESDGSDGEQEFNKHFGCFLMATRHIAVESLCTNYF